MTPMGTPLARQTLRMRALSTADSSRGLLPTMRMASACSIPATVALNASDQLAGRSVPPSRT
jgi:hypothetical protein